jgi:hypothetical protein
MKKLLLLVALAASGCGSDDMTSSPVVAGSSADAGTSGDGGHVSSGGDAGTNDECPYPPCNPYY